MGLKHLDAGRGKSEDCDAIVYTYNEEQTELLTKFMRQMYKSLINKKPLTWPEVPFKINYLTIFYQIKYDGTSDLLLRYDAVRFVIEFEMYLFGFSYLNPSYTFKKYMSTTLTNF